MTIETRIPTLFEVGTQVTDADGVIKTDWEDGRGLDFQIPAKNPHPNRYHFVFKDGAFKPEHLQLLMKSDSRLKTLLEKENEHLPNSRGAKRSRSEVTPDSGEGETTNSDAKTSDAQKEKSTSKDSAKPASESTKPAPKKKKVSEEESVPAKSDGTPSKKKEEKSETPSKKEKPTSAMEIDEPTKKETTKTTPKKKEQENASSAPSEKSKSSNEKVATPKSAKKVKA